MAKQTKAEIEADKAAREAEARWVRLELEKLSALAESVSALHGRVGAVESQIAALTSAPPPSIRRRI